MADEEFIGGYVLDNIYPQEFRDGKGKFFTVVTLDDGNTSIEYLQPFPQNKNRVKMAVTFIKDKNDIKEVTFKKFQHYAKEGWVELVWDGRKPMGFSYFTFEKLTAFLQLLTELDLVNLNEKRFALREDATSIDADMARKLKTLLTKDGGGEVISELLNSGLVTSHDIVNLGYRKSQLEVFRRLLNEAGYLETYRNEHHLTTQQPEKIWQHFFGVNEWIFGFGLDYRFMGILQDEGRIGVPDVAGRDGAITDFLMHATNFTVLVELKRPDTDLFDTTRARAGAWRLSSDLVEAVSQILQQKAAWQVKAESNAAGNFDRDGRLIWHRTADPKCLLVIGSDRAFNGSEKERDLKLRTFELFRRDSRNIEILTYDELYERASFVVNHKADADEEDLPF